LNLRRRGVDFGRVRDIERQYERLASKLLDLPFGLFQPRLVARDQPDARAVPGELVRRRPADPRRCPGNHHDLSTLTVAQVRLPGWSIHSSSRRMPSATQRSAYPLIAERVPV